MPVPENGGNLSSQVNLDAKCPFPVSFFKEVRTEFIGNTIFIGNILRSA